MNSATSTVVAIALRFSHQRRAMLTDSRILSSGTPSGAPGYLSGGASDAPTSFPSLAELVMKTFTCVSAVALLTACTAFAQAAGSDSSSMQQNPPAQSQSMSHQDMAGSRHSSDMNSG